MALQTRCENLWSIVLAAGEGKRLSTLTRALHGCDMPKQFAALWGGRSLLARTLDRTGALVPRQRTVVVVPENFKTLAQQQLGDYPGIKQSLWDMAGRYIPEVCGCLMAYRELIGHRGAEDFLRGIYPGLPVTDFCRDILQPAKGLAVTPMIGAGWSDCGAPERLFRAMEPTQRGARLLAQIKRQGPIAADLWAGTLRQLEARRAN